MLTPRVGTEIIKWSDTLGFNMNKEIQRGRSLPPPGAGCSNATFFTQRSAPPMWAGEIKHQYFDKCQDGDPLTYFSVLQKLKKDF